MPLEDKNAPVYGGVIGGAVSRAFAREGARVAALDEGSVEGRADAVVGETGGIDFSFNAFGLGDTEGVPLVGRYSVEEVIVACVPTNAAAVGTR